MFAASYICTEKIEDAVFGTLALIANLFHIVTWFYDLIVMMLCILFPQLVLAPSPMLLPLGQEH